MWGDSWRSLRDILSLSLQGSPNLSPNLFLQLLAKGPFSEALVFLEGLCTPLFYHHEGVRPPGP